MTHTKLRKITAFFCIIVVLTMSLVTLVACNKTKSIVDIFKSRNSLTEFKDSKLEFTLPAQWQVYTTSATSTGQAIDANSDVGYIPEENAFVITNGQNLSIIRCDDSRIYYNDGGISPPAGMMFPDYVGIRSLRVERGLIACVLADGHACVFDMQGKEVVARENTRNVSNQGIDNIIKILDGGLVAINYNYDNRGINGFTSIYRPTNNGGELVCRIQNEKNTLSAVTGFDNKYVVVTGNDNGDYIFRIPDRAPSALTNTYPTENGTVANNGQSNYYSEITYIGGGKFFIHEDWTVDNKDDCIYVDDSGKFYTFSRHIYTPDNDKRKEYKDNKDKLFIQLSNNYYRDGKAGISTATYLNDGYTYASYGLTINRTTKKAYYDQFILDSDLDVVMSLTGNYGVNIKGQTKDKVGHFDLIMTATDGYYYIPYLPSEINIYDSKGNRIGHNDRTQVLRQELNGNVIIAAIPNPDSSTSSLYGAFSLNGNEIIPFEYTSLSAFRGSYTIGEKYDSSSRSNRLYLLDITGKTVEKMSDGSTQPLSDIALDKNNRNMYAIGCYMFRVQRDGQTYFGIKNLNPNMAANIIMPATMKEGSVLYAPSSAPGEVFVFDKIYEGNQKDPSNYIYDVYRLTA